MNLLTSTSLWYFIGSFSYDSNEYWLIIVSELKNFLCFSYSFLTTQFLDCPAGDPRCQYHVQSHTHGGIFLTTQNTYSLDRYWALVTQILLGLRSSAYSCFYLFPKGISSFTQVGLAYGSTAESLTIVGQSIFSTIRQMLILRVVLKRMVAFGLIFLWWSSYLAD